MAIENITGNESVEELQQLYAVAENRLRMLDEKRAYTKPEIYQKVRSEYEAKLFELRVLLEEKGAGLQEALDAALAEKGALVARHHQIGDELEELELRAVIGEVDEATFADRKQALQQETAGIEAAIDELTAKIDNYQQLLGNQGVAEQPATVAAPAPAPKPEPVVEAVAPLPPVEPRPQPKPAPRPAPPAQPVAPRPLPVQQAPAAPRPAVTPAPAPAPAPRPVPQPAPAAVPRPQVAPSAPKAAPVPQPPAPEPPAPAAPVASQAPPSAPEMDELEKQFASILSSTMADTAPLEKPSEEELPPPARPAAVSQPAAEPEPQAPADVESHEGELKCPKCAAFNRADNWYCEKCGNELLNASDLLGGTK